MICEDEEQSRRIDIRSILAIPNLRREMMVRALMAIQHREGVDTTREQAEQAYDAVLAEQAANRRRSDSGKMEAKSTD